MLLISLLCLFLLKVEKSLESGVLENQLVEVVNTSPDQQQSSGYWLAKVVTICGPLLRYVHINSLFLTLIVKQIG